MSQGNVEIVRAAFRGWNERGADGMLAFFHDDIAGDFWQVSLVRGDRAAHCEEYLNRDQALEAAGLSE
jgi:hypothetical protein